MADPDQRAARRREVTTARRQPAPAPAPAPVVDPNAQLMAQLGQLLQQAQAPPAPVAPPPQQMAPAPVQFVNPELNPEEVAYFDSLLSRGDQTYAHGMAQNAYQQGTLGIEHGIQDRDLMAKFDKMREQLPGGYQRRGLMNSGVYQAGLGDYATSRTNATTDLNRRYQNQMGGLGMQASQLGSAYTTGQADINRARTAKLHTKASQLRAVR